jgi:hypothetical protein
MDVASAADVLSYAALVGVALTFGVVAGLSGLTRS